MNASAREHRADRWAPNGEQTYLVARAAESMKDPRGELRGSARLLRNQEQPRPSTHHNRTTSSMSESACYTLQIDIEHRFLRQTWYEPVTAGPSLPSGAHWPPIRVASPSSIRWSTSGRRP